MATITFEIAEDGIGLIRLNRPEKRNALDDDSVLALIDVLESDELADLASVVLVGEGTHFCTGVDLSKIHAVRSRAAQSSGTRLFAAFRNSAPVVIGSVHGYALGLGSGVAMACDLVVAADDAQFGYPGIQHGLVNAVTMVGLKEVVGSRKAMEYLVTGRRILADEALDVGMVNEVVPAADLLERSLELARVVAGHRTTAVQMTKQFFHESTDLSFASATRAAERVVQVARRAVDPATNQEGRDR